MLLPDNIAAVMRRAETPSILRASCCLPSAWSNSPPANVAPIAHAAPRSASPRACRSILLVTVGLAAAECLVPSALSHAEPRKFCEQAQRAEPSLSATQEPRAVPPQTAPVTLSRPHSTAHPARARTNEVYVADPIPEVQRSTFGFTMSAHSIANKVERAPSPPVNETFTPAYEATTLRVAKMPSP